ncbi:MAG: polyamine ABC transporter substrate-binding protein [Marinibacterium sp.]|nr:polyamine ABC transporter substrate-binding protein [Marinibacterium sp.]
MTRAMPGILTGPTLKGTDLMIHRLLSPALIVAALPALAADDVVHVYNWSDYIDEDTLAQFTEETGIKVVYDVFDTNEVLETKLLAGSSGYDVVVPSDTFLQRQIQAGVFAELDQSQLPNSQYLWPEITERTAQFDPGNAYSINYMWGTTGVGINVDQVRKVLGDDAPVNSLDLIFDPENMAKLAECGVTFLDSPSEVLPAALTYIGEDPNTQDPDVIEKTLPVLAAVRPHIRKFTSSDYITSLANGEICVAIGWSGDVLQARDRADEADNGVTIEYHAFKEGSVMWFDQMAIPEDAPNPKAAHAFLNFMMKPEVMAANSNYVWYPNGNLAAQDHMDAEILEDEAIYPTADTMQALYVTVPWEPKTNRKATRLWTKLKSGL